MKSIKKVQQVIKSETNKSPTKVVILATAITVLVIVALITSGFLFFFNDPESGDGDANKSRKDLVLASECAEIILNNYEVVEDPLKHPELLELIKGIESLQEHESSPDCIYPSVRYAITTNNLDDAISSFEALKKTYSAANGYDQALDGLIKAPEELNKEIEQLRKQFDGNADNMFYGPSI